MKLEAQLLEDNQIKIVCTGKYKPQRDRMGFKNFFCSTLAQHPQSKSVAVSFEQPNIDMSLLGLLLKFIKIDGYEIHLLVLHYSCFRMLEDLYLLEKFNVKYQKVSV